MRCRPQRTIQVRSRHSTIAVECKGHIAWNTSLASLVHYHPLTPKTTVVNVGHQMPFKATVNYWMECIRTDLFSSIERLCRGAALVYAIWTFAICCHLAHFLMSLTTPLDPDLVGTELVISWLRGPKSVCLLCPYLVPSNIHLLAIPARST